MKNDIEYLVSPNNSDICSAIIIALSLDDIGMVTFPFLSSVSIIYTSSLSYVVNLVIGFSLSSEVSSLTEARFNMRVSSLTTLFVLGSFVV